MSDVLPFPPASYMRLLAEALYSVAYLEWAILGDLDRLTSPPDFLTVEALSRSTMGAVADAVRRHSDSTPTEGNDAGF